MKTDKNTIIGFLLLAVLFIGFFWITNRQQQQAFAEKQRVEDSTKAAEAAKIKISPSATTYGDTASATTANNTSGAFQSDSAAKAELIVVENNLMKLSFNTRGATLEAVELKNYTSNEGKKVVLGGDKSGIYYTVNTETGRSASTSELIFTPQQSATADGAKVISFTLNSTDGRSIVHEYIVKPNEYMVDWNVHLVKAPSLLTNNKLNIHWQTLIHQHQKDFSYEKQQSRIGYLEDNDFDYNSAYSGAEHSFKKPVEWIAFKQQFFTSALVSKNKFSSGSMAMVPQADTTGELFTAEANMQLTVPQSAQTTLPFSLYFGPTDYHILKAYNNQMENLVDLGSGVFSFVKYINRYIIFPVFNFFASFIANYGWVIFFLTLFIRLVTAPLTYKSYLSGAKMKVLRPELDALRKKHGDDQQAYAMDQMKLYREAGVNPLGGCIPALLQIPIFFALYSFFNSNIDLRGVPFLWSTDLSQYDSIAHLPFSIPFGYGDHVSLFTLTAVITSFLISFYNMSMTPDTGNPAMKYMPYIFPFILLFIFNKLPSALTWYYTVSNIVTLLLQFVIQKYIIDHDKILAKIEDNRKKPKVKSKWAQRYEEMMETQKKMQDQKNKPKK